MKFLNIYKIISFMLMLVGSSYAVAVDHAAYTLDVYRSKQVTAEEIDKKFGNQLQFIALYLTKSKVMPMGDNAKELNANFEKLYLGLQKTGDYALMQVTPIVYPGGKKIGFTVDLVDKADAARLDGFLPKQTKNIPDPDHLIADWNKYDMKSFQEFFRTKKNPVVKSCPAFHCSFGFDSKENKPYAIKFNAEVPKYKNQIIDVLRNDKDETKRVAASYLLAHLKDGNEIIEILTPSITDSSNSVRNSVMRVLAQTVLKVKNPNIQPDIVIRALDFPTTVDRNKALYLMSSLADQPRFAQYFAAHACEGLLSQLRLEQLNLREGAYEVLIKISGKKYAKTDIKSWESWAAKSCPQQVKA